MTWIPELPSNKSTIVKSMSLYPEAMEAVEALGAVVRTDDPSLTPTQREAVATVVSVANHCRY